MSVIRDRMGVGRLGVGDSLEKIWKCQVALTFEEVRHCTMKNKH